MHFRRLVLLALLLMLLEQAECLPLRRIDLSNILPHAVALFPAEYEGKSWSGRNPKWFFNNEMGVCLSL